MSNETYQMQKAQKPKKEKKEINAIESNIVRYLQQ